MKQAVLALLMVGLVCGAAWAQTPGVDVMGTATWVGTEGAAWNYTAAGPFTGAIPALAPVNPWMTTYNAYWDRHYNLTIHNLQVTSVVIDSHANGRTLDLQAWTPVGDLTLNAPNGFTVTSTWGGYLYPTGTVEVKNAKAYDIGIVDGSLVQWGATRTNGVWSPTTLASPTYKVAAGGSLTFMSENIGNATFAGDGTTTVTMPGGSMGGSVNMTPGATVTLAPTFYLALDAVTGSGGKVIFDSATSTIKASGYNSSTQLFAKSGSLTFDTAGGAVINGANINLASRNTIGDSLNGGLKVTNGQTFKNSTFAGDGYIHATTGEYGNGVTLTMISKGSTFAPSNTNTVGSSVAGKLVFQGILTLDKNDTGKNSTLAFNVTGTGSTVGVDYSQVVVAPDSYDGTIPSTINSASNIAAGGTNRLADADIVVNIASGLDPHALDAQTYTLLSAPGNDLSTSRFANISFVSGAKNYCGILSATADGNVIVSQLRLKGDANSDGFVNFTDYLNLEQSFNAAPIGVGSNADFDGNGIVSFSDYLALEQNFNTHAAVPEPMTLTLLGLGAVALLRRRK